MGLIDSIDNVLATMKGRHAGQRDAARFARRVQLGRTYWSVETFMLPTGPQKLATPWIFDKRCPVTGVPRCGAVAATGAWLRNGPLYDSPPCMTHAEYMEATDVDPVFIEGLIADAVGDRATARKLVRA